MLFDPSTTEGLFRSIKVNIFAVDPVSGMETGVGPDSESRRLIPPTVKNYVGVLATGENRTTFAPQDLSRVQVSSKASSNVIFLPFPGKHSTVAQDNDPKGIMVSDICFSIWHTAFSIRSAARGGPGRSRPMSNLDMLEGYSKMIVDSAYGKIKQKGVKQFLIGKGFGQRDFAKKLDQYTQNSAYFINEHHRVLFETTCPNLYSWLFTRATVMPGLSSKMVASSSTIGREVAGAWAVRPNFISSLENLGIEIVGTNIRLPAPGSSFDPRQLNDLQASANMRGMGLL